MSGPLRVALLSTHPIQYQAPWFRALAAEPDLEATVLFAQIPTPRQQGVGFGVPFEWDVPLLTGFRSVALTNVSSTPSLSTFAGCDTPGIGRLLADERAQALVVNGWHTKSYLQGLMACRRRGIPCLVRGESNTFRPRPAWVRLAHRILMSQYSAFLAIGQANHEFYRRSGVPEARIFQAPYGVDNRFFEARAEEAKTRRSALRAEWGLEERDFVVLFAGKLIEKKRPGDLIRAAARARSGGASGGLRVLLVGDGPLRFECERLLADLAVPGRVVGFLNQTQMPNAYAVADALVLPSDAGETWGLVVNEAMACGLPVAVSDRVGCHPDLVTPGETGEVVPLGDVQALARVLSAWVDDPAAARAQGARAKQRVQEYSVAAAVRGTRQALDYVTHSRRRDR